MVRWALRDLAPVLRGLLQGLEKTPLRHVTAASSCRPVLPVFKTAPRHKSKVCVRDNRGEYSYLGLARSSKALAEKLSHLLDGRQQERVGVLCPTSGFAVLGQWAAWMSGQIVVPMDTSSPSEKQKLILKSADLKVVLTTADLSEGLNELAKTFDFQVLIMESELLDKAQPELKEGSTEEKDLSPDSYGLDADFYGKSDALIVFTSGTTGPPKGVLFSFLNLDAQVKSVVTPWALTSDDRLLNLRPLTTTDGITCGVLAPLSLGASVVLLENFVLEEIWTEILGMIQKPVGRMNLMLAASSVYRNLIEEFELIKLRRKWTDKLEAYVKGLCIQNIRLMLSTGAPLPKSTQEKWEAYTGQEVLEVYSLTEGGVIATPRPSSTKRNSTVGFPVPGIKMKIMSDDGNVVAEGDSSGTKVLTMWEKGPCGGNLWLKGENIATKYLEEKSPWTIDGWFKTGDILSYSKGQYSVLGRKLSDIVKLKSYKISLLQIEAAILDIPEVQDVVAFNMTENGVPVIAAAISRKTGQVLSFDQVKSFLLTRFPDYAVPSVFIDVPEVPRNHKGVIIRNEAQNVVLKQYLKQHTNKIKDVQGNMK